MNTLRIKNNLPFSKRLNDFIVERTKNIKFKAGNFKEVDFDTFKKETSENGYMKISNENCEGTIFGNTDINVLFRAWHDAIHLELNEGFDYMQEARVAFKQASELPKDWHYEKNLILIEVIGQASYHEKTNSFVDNQREFTNNVIYKGLI